MDNYKLKLKELIVIMVIAAPIGSFLYLNNYNKINYEIKARRGFAVTDNFCENYSYSKMGLMGIQSGDIDLISQKYKSRQLNLDSVFDGKMKILSRDDLETYEISFNGKIGQERKMVDEAQKILEDISKVELSNFNTLYKSVKFHCKSGEFSVFKLVPMEKIDIEFPARAAYKKLHLYLLLISPLFILYLLLIAYKYVNQMNKNKNNKTET